MARVDDFKYCPRCAGTLAPGPVEDKVRPVCGSCHFVWYVDPKLAVAVVLPYDAGILPGRAQCHDLVSAGRATLVR